MQVSIALAQFTAADKETNIAKIEKAIADAAEQGAQLIAFHELATTEYFCYENQNRQRFNLAETVPGPSTDRVSKAAEKYDIHVLLPLYEKDESTRYNSAAYIEPDKGVVDVYRKSHIPVTPTYDNEEGANEAFYFDQGHTGFRLWETSLGLKVGTLICFDRHFPEAARIYGLQEADIIFTPTASYRSFIIESLWGAELQAMAFQHSYYVAGINKVGPVVGVPTGDRRYPGQSMVVDPKGKIMATMGDEESILHVSIDSELPGKIRQEGVRFYDKRRPELYEPLCEVRS